MSETTKGARRAATAIVNDACGRVIFAVPWQTEKHKAEIIDRETGLPDLIAALREVQKHINGNRKFEQLNRVVGEALRKASEE
jgi:hypothetical protein